MIDPEGYCREIEAYLCRKNDGHLIRIVGPAFDEVSGWARDGIPLKVAFAGVDRYFERYYRKGPRRRPVRIEFCKADVLDAFDDWRRAVGVAGVPDAAASDEPRNKRVSLATHLERVIAQLTRRRGSEHEPLLASDALDQLVRQLDAMQAEARAARGDARAALLESLERLDRELLSLATTALSQQNLAALAAEADAELAPFRSRMLPEALAHARQAALDRLIRDRFALPKLTFD